MRRIILAIALIFSFSGVVCAEQKPAQQRIIALAPHAVELLFSLGVGDRIIATTEYADYPSAAKDIPRVGGYHGLNVERIFELQPDLIIAWENGNKIEDIQRMEELGLPVFRSKTETLDALPAHLLKLGKLLGVEGKAEALAKDFRDRLQAIRDHNAKKAPVTFFYQLWLEPLRTMTSQSWVNDSLLSCNGQNIFDDTGLTEYPQVSMEHVLLKQPQAIVVPSHHGDGLTTAELWLQWPEIPAVKNEHIFYVDGDVLHRYALRVLDGIESVCAALDQVRVQRAVSQAQASSP